MHKVVVDTNIVFSGLLNSTGIIGQILNSRYRFEFYSCYLLKTELLRHRTKILKFSRYSSDELDEVEQRILSNIEFIDEHLIPPSYFLTAEQLLQDIDLDDTPFVALADYLDARLWTGDKELISGLANKQYARAITTSQLSNLI